MAYQTLGAKKGTSDSEGKLAVLQLPDMTGKSFLDLGCNIGFFCREAKKRGAIRTVGVDDKRKSIKDARELDPDGQYLAMDWFEALRALKGQFDVIIHTSAFHYVTDQKEFLFLVEQKLAPGGVFILECGTINSSIPRYHNIRRTAFVKHITSALLKQLLTRFEVTTVGRSVDQSGDPVPRFVYHCTRRKPTVMILGGETASGKSYLGRTLNEAEDAGTIRMDELIPSLVHCPDPLIATLMQEYFKPGKGLAGVSHAVMSAGLVKEFAAAVAELVPNCFRLIVLEGQIFSDGRMRQAIANELIDRGFVIWESKRLMTRDVSEHSAAGINLLHPADDTTFEFKAVSDKFVRPMPVDNEIMLIANKGAPQTSACWGVSPAPGQKFECSVRVHERSKPIHFTFDAVDSSKVPAGGSVFDDSVVADKSTTAVVEGADLYHRISLELPAEASKVLLRVTVRMANAKDPNAAARVFIASPRVVAPPPPSV